MGNSDNANAAWWVSTKEFLPTIGERVLIISKFGHVSDAMYTDYGMGDAPTFRTDGFKPHDDVKWWMPIPTDGWHDIKETQPKAGEVALTMGMYGEIFNGTWRKSSYSNKFEFSPFVWEVLFWREMPRLPEGVLLSTR